MNGMNKYREALIASVRKQIGAWAENGQTSVAEEELYRFLHSVKGTAGTIGMTKLSAIAGEGMTAIEAAQAERAGETDGRTRRWSVPVLLAFLGELTDAAALAVPDEHSRARTAWRTGIGDEGEELRLLAVVADPALSDLLRKGLEPRGCRLLFAERPEQAAGQCRAFRPDCVLLELARSDATAFDVLLELRDITEPAYIQTTIISGDDSRANRIKSFRLGADDYVPLPLDIAELAARLDRQLARKRRFERR